MNQRLCAVRVAGIGEVIFPQFLHKGRAYLDISITPGKGDPWPPTQEDMGFLAAAINKTLAVVDLALLSRDQSPAALAAAADVIREGMLLNSLQRPERLS
jgi:hypothetical protein